jgi:CBS domain-containing protein
MPSSTLQPSQLPATIEPYMHRKVTVLHGDTPLNEVALAMREKAIGCVLVSDHEGYIIGVATDRDLACRGYGEGMKPGDPLIRIMTPQPVFVEPSATLDEVVWRMEAGGIRRIPVLEPTTQGRARAVGMVTLDDLIAAQKIDEYRLTRIVQAQVLRRMGEFAHERGRIVQVVDAAGRPVTASESVSQFHDRIFERARIDRLGLSRDRAIDALWAIWETLVGRLHHTGAMHLISQLPVSLQDRMLKLPFGPDRRNTEARLVGQLSREWGWPEQRTREGLLALSGVWCQMVDENELSRVRAQLPPDLASFCMAREPDTSRERAA